VPFPPTGGEAFINLDSDGTPPSEGHRSLFSELVRRYESLRPAVGAAMFELWEPHLADWPGDRPPLVTSVDEILRLTTLDIVTLAPPHRVILGYGFVEAVGWDDATFSINLDDWQVSWGSLDD